MTVLVMIGDSPRDNECTNVGGGGENYVTPITPASVLVSVVGINCPFWCTGCRVPVTPIFFLSFDSLCALPGSPSYLVIKAKL